MYLSLPSFLDYGKFLVYLRDKNIEEGDIENYNDINRYFYLKLLFNAGDLASIYTELRILINNENVFEKSIIFIYYFGKFIKMFILEIEADDPNNLKTKNKQLFDIIKDRNEGTYNKFFNVMYQINPLDFEEIH
jgi:hypothetical protein